LSVFAPMFASNLLNRRSAKHRFYPFESFFSSL